MVNIMTYILYAVILIIAGFISLQVFMITKMKRKKGMRIEPEKLPAEFRDKFNKNKLLVYLFSPACSACKVMEPVIDEFSRKNSNVMKIDIRKNMDIARYFGVMGTPSTIVVKKGVISDILIGIKTESDLLKSYNGE